MRCPLCGRENPEDASFCGLCGAALVGEATCSDCGRSNPATETFCHGCGRRLRGPPPTAAAAPAPIDGERRQLTVMFADLADSTALSGRLDPEDLRDAVRRYHAACAKAIERFGGYVGKWLGDGVLAYFGYPASHEDDAQRAIRAGLEIVAWARQQTDAGDQPMAIRVGLHSGLTVIGEMGSGERIEHADVVGETPNIAARVQSVAPRNAVVMSPATERLAHGFFLTESLGEQRLKGVARPIEVFRILGESGAASRLDTAERLTPLVGREQETSLLRDRWQKAAEGQGQVVVLSGEPGIGKSRLVRTLLERLPDEHLRITLQCSQFHQNSALYPLIEHFERLLQSDDAATPVERLAAMLDEAGVETTTSLPLFAALLGLPPPEAYAPLDLTPEQQKQKTYEATLAWLDAEAGRHPVLLVCEDLHWMDPSTLELVGMLVEREEPGKMLVLLTCRPEFTPPWPQEAHTALLQLARLGRDEAHEVMTRVAGGRRLPAEVAAQIVARTDGVPLFVEELTKMVLESGLLREEGDRLVLDGPLPPLAIPETLQDSLMARLDRLASAKEVAQLGATMAREFSEELIAAVSPLSPDALARALDALVESGLVYRRGFGTGARYVFKHSLVQAAAYQSLLKSTRARYHQSIAEALVSRFPDVAASQPEVVAHHYTEAGLAEQAVGYWLVAGERALARSAHQEAIAQLKQCLQVTASLAQEAQRDRSELPIQIALGSAFRVTEGYGSTRTAAAYARARELCYKLGATSELVPVLGGMWTYQLIYGKLQTAQELATECLRIAERESDSGLIVQACRLAGGSDFWFGNFQGCQKHVERGASLYDLRRDEAKVSRFQGDGLVGCLYYEAWAAWFLGYPEQARELSRRAVEHARALKHHHTLVLALAFASGTYLLRREMAVAQADGEEALRLSIEQEFPQWAPMSQVWAGAAIAGQGDADRGIERIDEGLAEWSRLGSKVGMTWFLGWRAEALLLGGRNSEAAATVVEALRTVDETGERCYEAELHRLHGAALLGRDDVVAERDFLSALEIARAQKAKSLELRAARDLARLWQSQGLTAEALALFEPVYAFFTEGFDTLDLIEARELIDTLHCQ
jgi:class 3 adenylate cyclase/predicted ATPase